MKRLFSPSRQLNLQAFDIAMRTAIKKANVGLYFEMGGCWAFAHALHTRLTALGYRSQLTWRPVGFVHAWVRHDTHNLDYRGVFCAAPGEEPLSNLSELRNVARETGGMNDAMFTSDVALASRILDDVFAHDLSLQTEELAA